MINLFKLDFSVFQATVFVEDAPIPPPPLPHRPRILKYWGGSTERKKKKKKKKLKQGLLALETRSRHI